MLVTEEKGEGDNVKLRQICLVISSIGCGIATIPLALSMTPKELWIPYVAWEVWLLGVTPIVLFYLLSKGRN
jgi:hypothetical protein